MSPSTAPTLSVEVYVENSPELGSFDYPQDSAMWNYWFQRWLTALSDELPPSDRYELSLRLSSDRQIQALNAQYRGKPQPTDVLAFAALETEFPQLPEESSQTEPLYLGDLVISVETAARQAAECHHSLTIELAWLATHGLLHLLGWDHPDEESLRQMLARQAELLEILRPEAVGEI